MNKSRRKRIAIAIKELEAIINNYDSVDLIKSDIEDILWEEEDAYNNMPEGLQYSIRGEESSDAIDSLQEAADALDEALGIIDEINDIDFMEEDPEGENSEWEEFLKECDIDNCISQAISSLENII